MHVIRNNLRTPQLALTTSYGDKALEVKWDCVDIQKMELGGGGQGEMLWDLGGKGLSYVYGIW